MELDQFVQGLSREEKICLLKRLEISDNVFEFATKHHRSAKLEPLQFTGKYKHLVEIYLESSADKTVVMMSGAQLGKSDYLTIYTLASTYSGLNVFFCLPNLSFAKKYVPEKFGRPMEFSDFYKSCLLYTSPSPRDRQKSRMPSSA